MNQIKAIAFDLFNTLITAAPNALEEAHGCLTRSLRESGFSLDRETFQQAYREAALRFIRLPTRTAAKPTTASGSAQH